MPKRQINVRPGEALAPDLKEFLAKQFELRQIERLERLGGRILISVAAPYVKGQKRDRTLVIDDSFLLRLKAETTNIEGLRELLAPLSVAQLKDLSRLLGEPVRSAANREEIASQLIRNLQSEAFWHRISTPGEIA